MAYIHILSLTGLRSLVVVVDGLACLYVVLGGGGVTAYSQAELE